MADSLEVDPLAAAVKKAFKAPFDAVVKIAPDKGEPLFIDGRKTPPAVSAAAPDTDSVTCQWRGSREALTRAMGSERAFESAYVAGRILVSGDMSVMARLAFEDNR